MEGKMKLYVKDLIPEKIEDMKFLFLLESPFIDEVNFKMPLAGSSGKAVTNCLFNSLPNINIPKDYPFGCYIKNNKDDRFGIINCSNKPMDKKVYETIINDDKESEIIILDRIRKNYKTKSSNRHLQEDKEMHKELLNDLTQKLLAYHKKNNSFIIIACGILAKTFLSEIVINPSHQIIIMPHPSRGQWNRKENKEKLKSLIHLLKNHL